MPGAALFTISGSSREVMVFDSTKKSLINWMDEGTAAIEDGKAVEMASCPYSRSNTFRVNKVYLGRCINNASNELR